MAIVSKKTLPDLIRELSHNSPEINMSDSISDDVVILARTKMNNQHVCVGGYSLQQKRYVRLLTSDGQNLNEVEPYQISEIYKIEYQKLHNIIPPHSEDVCVHDSTFKKKMLPDEFIQLLNEISIPNLHIKDLFNGLLHWECGKGFLLNETDIPNNSVAVVRLNHDLFLSKYKDNEFYFNDSGVNFAVKYVGDLALRDLKHIKAGRIIRFSLARWWDGNGSFECKRAYLQLSAVY